MKQIKWGQRVKLSKEGAKLTKYSFPGLEAREAVYLGPARDNNLISVVLEGNCTPQLFCRKYWTIKN
jgi:hypothetical protein